MSKKETTIPPYAVTFSTRVKTVLFTESPIFQRFLLLLIILNAVALVYLASTLSGDEVTEHPWFSASQLAIQFFLLELCLRVYANGLRFFKNIWNVADAIIVLVALYPPFALISVLRIVRLMRATGVLTRAPGAKLLNMIVRANAGTAFSFLMIFFVLAFTQSVLCQYLLAQYDPANFNSLGDSLIFSFQFMFLERPDAIIEKVTFYHEHLSTLFFGLWLVTKLLIGLFIALVLANSVDVIKKSY